MIVELKATNGTIVRIPIENFKPLDEDVKEWTAWYDEDELEHSIVLQCGYHGCEDGWYYYIEDDLEAIVSLDEFLDKQRSL